MRRGLGVLPELATDQREGLTMIDTMHRPTLPTQDEHDEQYLGVSVRISRTDQADERLRYSATVTALAVEVAGLEVGDVLGYGVTPARARRRATDKIANRRRGPVRPAYTVQGVRIFVGPNADEEAPTGHAFLAVVTEVDQASPLRALVRVGQVLARKPSAAGTADRAYLLLGQLAERARQDVEQQQLVAAGAQLAAGLAGLPGAPAPVGDWDDDALCRQVDPELFFPEKGGASAQAVAICGRCSIKVECLAQALDRDEHFGIWGGYAEHSRRLMRRRGITGDMVRAADGLPATGQQDDERVAAA